MVQPIEDAENPIRPAPRFPGWACEFQQVIDGFRSEKRLQAITRDDCRLPPLRIDGEQQGMIVFAAVAIARERAGIEEPEHMHGKGVLLRKLVHHHLQNELWETPLDIKNAVFDFRTIRCFERARGVRHHRCQARQGTHQRASSRIGQAAGRAFGRTRLQRSLAIGAPDHVEDSIIHVREKRGENLWRDFNLGCSQRLVFCRFHQLAIVRGSGRGFALVVCLSLMVLLAILAVGLVSIAAIELRRTSQSDKHTIAQANARLALVLAIGQLQKNLGPDQRVSATAEILSGEPHQPHWTGAWRTTLEDGAPVFRRDDLAGGLSDARSTLEPRPDKRVSEWLVSGSGDPLSGTVSNPVEISSTAAGPPILVGKIPMANASGKTTGHHAWWTGDLGVRANIATRDSRHELQVEKGDPGGEAWFRVMASQAVDPSLMKGEVKFKDEDLKRLVSPETTSLTSVGKDWAREHAFDFTVDSRGVLADSLRGGLRRDLTAYFNGPGEVPAWKGLPGINGDSNLLADESTIGIAGTTGNSRLAKAGPRFGLLRDWARSNTAFLEGRATAKLADVDSAAGGASAALALANENPVKLAGNQRASLHPVLVEATNFVQMSTYFHRMGRHRWLGIPIEIYQIRQFMYPRVVLWNPYNLDLKMEKSIIMIQGNGRQEMWTENININKLPEGWFREKSEWINFEGGRSTEFAPWPYLINSEGYKDPYMGSYYFTIPETIFQPGECLVFSPPRSAEYDGLSVYRPGSYDLSKNVLSCEVSPDPSRGYYVSGSEISGGIDFLPVEFWYEPTPSIPVANQSDDTRAILKQIDRNGPITFEVFDDLPQIAVLSAALQFGAGREPRIAWSKYERMPMELLDRISPKPTVIPNVRTRESIRLRWFKEHPSNTINSGALTGTSHFEDALLANWNPRAAFAIRSPWENIGGDTNGGPWFFGAYTRDLFDQAVGWEDQVPVPRRGRYHGNPFGTPQEGVDRYVLFDVPRSETGVVSLGQLQHVKLSDLVWHPSYAIGNSLADPRLGTGGYKGLHRTSPMLTKSKSAAVGGFHEEEIGWSSDLVRSPKKDEWAVTARALLASVPEKDNLVYDLSFEANHALWDRYFLSSGSESDKQSFLKDPLGNPLPNGRMHPLATGSPLSLEKLNDFHQSASALMVHGAFNVNSTSVEAWKALLGSTRPSGYGTGDRVAFPRVLDAPGGAWKKGDPVDSDDMWAGHRELTPTEIDGLARAIVREVKKRGPFISLADFINRRLAEDETGRMGALQAAIESAGLNSDLIDAYELNNQSALPDYRHPDNIPDSTRMEQTLKPPSKAWGAPAWLTQGDVLQSLAPALAARSDSFVIRAYGDAVDDQGKILAIAWCEAVVQRTPEPLDPDDSGLNPRLPGTAKDFGRRFVVASFRWLGEDEI